MSTELTQEEANKLFNSVSQAMREDDSNKLSELLAEESPEEQEQPVEEETHEEEEDSDTPEESTEDTDTNEESADEADEEQTTKDDPLAALRNEIEALKKAQHSFSSQMGRVPSIQRRLAEYDKQLAALKSATSSQTSEKVKPKIDKALKDLEDTDPALANTLRSMMGEALSEVDNGTTAREIERLQSLREIEYAEYAAEQRNILLGKYPNAADVFKSDHWKSWKKEQPDHILSLATSDSAEAVLMALDLYKRDMLIKFPELNKDNKQDDKVVEEKNEEATKIEEQRKRQQKQTSADVRNGKAPVKSKGPLDAEALFKQYSEQLRKEIRGD